MRLDAADLEEKAAASVTAIYVNVRVLGSPCGNSVDREVTRDTFRDMV